MAGIGLGMKVQDVVTGFEGIATSRVEYLNGCIQYYVQPLMLPDNDKKTENKYPNDGAYVDHQRLIVLDPRSILDATLVKHPPAAAGEGSIAPGGEMREEPPASYRG